MKITIGAILIVLAVGLTVVMVTSLMHRHAGLSFVFGPPKAITLVEGGEIAEREVKFPNFLPFQWYTSFSVTPLFKAGDVIEIDLSSLGDRQVNDFWIRVNEDPLDKKDRDIYASYIFKMTYTNKLPNNGKKVVRLKIDHAILDDTIAHRQKESSGEWFWLREIYYVIPI